MITAGIFILGLITGSFLSAAIFRIHSNENLVKGRSKCPKCHKKLSALNLIPLLSYIFQKGRCAYCKKPISVHYPMLELITGITFIAIYGQFGLWYLILSALLIAIVFEDILYKEISNQFVVPATVIAFAIQAIEPINMIIAVGIAFIFFGGQIWLSKGAWLGGGDLKLGLLMGILLGWEQLIVATMAGYLLGATLSLISVIFNKSGLKTEIAFGPFLIFGTFLSIFYGEIILNWYLTSLI